MAIVITPLLTTINEADSTTGWSVTATTLNTESYIEETGCLSAKVTQAAPLFLYSIGASTDLSNNHLRVWILVTTALGLDTQSGGGIRIRVTGAATTDFGEWFVGGK